MRFRVQEEGRAAAGGRGGGLSARPAGRAAGRRRSASARPNNKVEVETNDSNKFCSLAFKLWTDPYAGKLVFFRVYSGQLEKGDMIYNPRTRKRERVSRLMIIQGSERKDITEVYAGDIAALVGLRNITTGDTLCDEEFDVTLEPPTFPEPVISMAVEPKTKAGPRQDVRGPATAGGGRPDVPLFHQRGDRPAHHRGHGRAASGNHH